MITQLVRLTRFPRAVLLAAVLVLVGAVVYGSDVQKALGSGGTVDEGSDSALVTRVVERDAPALAPNLVVVVRGGDAGLDSPAVAAAAANVASTLRDDRQVTGVQSYWPDHAPALVSKDGRSAVITAHVKGDETRIASTLTDLRPRLHDAAGDIETDLAGPGVIRETMDATIASDLQRAELIAFPITFAILLWVFGGFWASLLPLVVGAFAIVVTNAVLRVIAQVTDVSVFALNLTTALGLGLAIDYSLLMVRRYREEVAGGSDPRAAITTTMHTAGRTVAFSGLTVAAALAVMLIFPLYFLRSFGYAGVSVVLAAMVGALVVTPCAMVLLGARLIPRRQRFARRHVANRALLDGGWARIALWVGARARVAGPVAVVALALLALPFASINFGSSDERQLPVGNAVRDTATELRTDFTGAEPSFATVALPQKADDAAVTDAVDRLKDLPGVTGVQPVPTAEGTLLMVASTVEPSSGPGEDLVRDLRSAVAADDGHVGGATASFLDTKDAIAERFPLALALIVATALLLVFALSGSLLVPLVAVVTNGLSLTAMFGAIVLVFQEGHLSDLLGFTAIGKIDVALPLLMACVAFGLSMDYGVFLLARIVEERQHATSDRVAVATALQRTGGVITAAALILSTVLVAIGTSQITNTKMLGLGVALAVLVDALVVRTFVVPALLELLGRAAWWAPKPLRALHERYGWREDEPEPAPRPRHSPQQPVPVG